MKPSQSMKSALNSLARSCLYLIPKNAVMTILSGRLKGKKWINGSGIYRCWLGFYEADKQNLFVDFIKPEMVVFDIGANAGIYTLLAADLVGPRGKVIAFEPVLRNVDYIKRHLELNGVKNAELIEAAVGGADGEVTFELGENDYSGRIAAGGGLTVKAVRLDSLVGSGRIPPPAFLKMDIEGAEYDALRGASDTLTRHRPIIFLATHNPEVHVQCCDLLTSFGYDLRPIDGEPLAASRELIGTPREGVRPSEA